jgi:prepilin-type N-terminal cleavage/methylation domain-containing protein
MKKHDSKHPSWSARTGWSLIELLTVVVVLSIAAVITIPYAASGDSAAGQSAARLLVSEILGAQMDAIATQSFRRVHFYDDGTGWCVLVLDSSQLNIPFDSETAIYAEDEFESQGQNQQSIIHLIQDSRFNNVMIKDPTFDINSTDVTFDPTGGIIANDGTPSLGGSVELTSGSFSWVLTVAPLTGKISISESTGIKN